MCGGEGEGEGEGAGEAVGGARQLLLHLCIAVLRLVVGVLHQPL